MDGPGTGIDAPFPEGCKLADKKVLKEIREAVFGPKGNTNYSPTVMMKRTTGRDWKCIVPEATIIEFTKSEDEAIKKAFDYEWVRGGGGSSPPSGFSYACGALRSLLEDKKMGDDVKEAMSTYDTLEWRFEKIEAEMPKEQAAEQHPVLLEGSTIVFVQRSSLPSDRRKAVFPEASGVKKQLLSMLTLEAHGRKMNLDDKAWADNYVARIIGTENKYSFASKLKACDINWDIVIPWDTLLDMRTWLTTKDRSAYNCANSYFLECPGSSGLARVWDSVAAAVPNICKDADGKEALQDIKTFAIVYVPCEEEPEMKDTVSFDLADNKLTMNVKLALKKHSAQKWPNGSKLQPILEAVF